MSANVVLQRPVAAAILVLCGYMTLSQLVIVPTWKGAFYPSFADSLHQTENVPTPDNSASKYKGQVAVVLLHHLPSFCWCLLMPLQLLRPPFDKSSKRLFSHKLLGYTTAACAVATMCGFSLIEYKGLGVVAPDVPNSLRFKAVWFLLTLGIAVFLARQKQYKLHRAWMLRHAAAGMWVIVQRFLIIMLAIAGGMGFVNWRAGPDEGARLRANAFMAAALAGFVISTVSCELLLWSERRQRRAAVKAA